MDRRCRAGQADDDDAPAVPDRFDRRVENGGLPGGVDDDMRTLRTAVGAMRSTIASASGQSASKPHGRSSSPSGHGIDDEHDGAAIGRSESSGGADRTAPRTTTLPGGGVRD